MTAILDWLTSVGLLGLVAGFAYREWQAWRSRRRELRGLLHLLDLEVSHNQLTLSTFEDDPDFITEPIGQPIRTVTWEDSKARLVQLIRNKDHFGYIAVFYNNLENVILPAMQAEQLSDRTKQAFISALLVDMQEMAQGTRDIIHRYIPPPKDTAFGSLHDLLEGPQELED